MYKLTVGNWYRIVEVSSPSSVQISIYDSTGVLVKTYTTSNPAYISSTIGSFGTPTLEEVHSGILSIFVLNPPAPTALLPASRR